MAIKRFAITKLVRTEVTVQGSNVMRVTPFAKINAAIGKATALVMTGVKKTKVKIQTGTVERVAPTIMW
jgi:hypothetical protein